MALPIDFQFNQSNLQDYVDCRRRFQLRYLIGLPWPAAESEPASVREKMLRLGIEFHLLVHQHSLNIPVERLTPFIRDEALQRWWANYLKFQPEGLPSQRYIEVRLNAPLGGHRLVAKYDLIAVDVGQKLTIVDWKTSLKKPSEIWMRKRLQTKVYRYLLVEAAAHLNNDRSVNPDQVEMIYWFSEHPEDLVVLPYSEAEFREDSAYLKALVKEISELKDDRFELTQDEGRCKFCRYRSICDRGSTAADWEGSKDKEDDVSFETFESFDQIGELEN